MDDHSYSMVLRTDDCVNNDSRSWIPRSVEYNDDHSYSTVITSKTWIVDDHSYSLPYLFSPLKKKMKKRYSSNRYCSVFQCFNRADQKRSFHVMPSIHDKKRRKRWIQALRMAKVPKCALVCDAHFNKSDYKTNLGKKKRLRNDAVPSRNLPVSSIRKIPSEAEKKNRENRALRAINRNLNKALSTRTRREDILFVDVENWSSNDDFNIKTEPIDVAI